MIALSVSDLSLAFGTDVILSDVSFAVNDGDKVGIIGVNGAGKTTLFRLIGGELTPDSGAVYLQKGHKIGILEQNPDLSALPADHTMLDYMITAFPDLLAAEEEIARLEEELARTPKEDEEKLPFPRDAPSPRLYRRATDAKDRHALGRTIHPSRSRASARDGAGRSHARRADQPSRH